MIKIGHARHSETGGKYGKAGDQTGEEVSRQDWYLHKKGWVCIRAKDAAVREKIAQDIEGIEKGKTLNHEWYYYQ